MRRAIGATLAMAAGVAWAGMLPAPAPAQQPKKAEAKNSDEKKAEAVEPIDPRGEPRAAKMRGLEAPNVALAYERDGWQVQCRPGDAGWTRIDGTIEVVGGTIDRVGGISDLETSARGGRNQHVDSAEVTKRRIEFKIWVTRGGTDTFRFYVSPEAETIRFRFRVANKPTAEAVFIGKAGRHPAQAEFALDAHPERRPADR